MNHAILPWASYDVNIFYNYIALTLMKASYLASHAPPESVILQIYTELTGRNQLQPFYRAAGVHVISEKIIVLFIEYHNLRAFVRVYYTIKMKDP